MSSSSKVLLCSKAIDICPRKIKFTNKEREVSISFLRTRHRHNDEMKIVNAIRGEQRKNFVVKIPILMAIVKIDIL